MRQLTIKKHDITLSLLSNNLKYKVVKNGYEWISDGRCPHIVFQKKIGKKYRWFLKFFSSAKKINHSIENDCITSKFSSFKVFGKVINVAFIVKAKILENGHIDFSIKAENESEIYLKCVSFPSAFNAVKYDKNNSYSIDPIRQGVYLPDTWKKNRKQIFLMTKYWRKVNTGDAYMAVWGRVCDEKGYSCYAENSDDLTLFSSYGKKKAFLTAPNWYSSLGKLSYERVLHYHFMDECDYVKIAKDFRENEIKKGKFISIDDKIKKNPNVAKLIGAPIIHWRIMEHNVESSGFYKKTGVGTVLHYTFDETAELFKKFKELGLDKAYVHTDGWGNRGYDNLHPYVLPPCEKAGGYGGLKRLSDTCEEIGYEFGLHDQYRDFYLDSPVYDEKLAVYDVNLNKSYCDYWAGGAHNWLDSTLAKPFVERTYRELSENDINIKGTYLDVWGIVMGDENYNPNHMVTRTESLKARGECFDMLREKGIIVSSEEVACNMVEYLDLVHHAPYQLTPQERGEAVGVPIPFTNLVYHDSVFVPWHIEGVGGWGIPNGDAGKMHCILNGQTPYFNNSMASMEKESDKALKDRIRETLEVAKINELVYNAEMVKHEFLSKDYRVQKATFSNGVEIIVDFDKNTYKVNKNN